RRFERTDRERQEVGRERRRGREIDDPPAGRRRLALDRPVPDRRLPLPHRDGDAEPCLERRLVEAREDAARVRGLALGEGVLPPLGRDAVETAEVLVERAAEAE